MDGIHSLRVSKQLHWVTKLIISSGMHSKIVMTLIMIFWKGLDNKMHKYNSSSSRNSSNSNNSSQKTTLSLDLVLKTKQITYQDSMTHFMMLSKNKNTSNSFNRITNKKLCHNNSFPNKTWLNPCLSNSKWQPICMDSNKWDKPISNNRWQLCNRWWTKWCKIHNRIRTSNKWWWCSKWCRWCRIWWIIISNSKLYHSSNQLLPSLKRMKLQLIIDLVTCSTQLRPKAEILNKFNNRIVLVNSIIPSIMQIILDKAVREMVTC